MQDIALEKYLEDYFGQSVQAPRSVGSQFRRLLDRLPAGAYTCDVDGLITYFNSHAVRVWGRVPELNDPVDRFCGSFKLFSSDGVPLRHDECWMALALQNDIEYNGEEIIVERPGGERVTVLAYASPIHDESGVLLGAVNVLVDISDRKRAEIELEEADRAKNELLATLAHELRNPLAPVRNAIQILRLEDAALGQRQRWALDVMDRQVRQMSRLIGDLLDIARISHGQLELRKERIELAQVVRLAVETSQPSINERDQAFAVTLPPEPVYLDADPTRLAQAIGNLLNNASRYTQRGGDIRLSAERRDATALVTVSDTGVGIAPEMLSRIFEMFAHSGQPPGHSTAGLGIGLTLVKRLAGLHGGTVSAHSDGLGEGSAFSIRLPVAAEVRPVAEDAVRERIAAADSPRRVLIVDDRLGPGSRS